MGSVGVNFLRAGDLADEILEIPGRAEVLIDGSEAHIGHWIKIGQCLHHQFAHRIEAAADMFLMPSRYEPCGLNQLYSLRYGTVPIVRATGGLADTIVDAHEATVANGTAVGFSFESYLPEELDRAIRRAVEAFGNQSLWSQLVETGMRQDWSWNRSARHYVELYQKIMAQVELAMWN